MTIKIKALSGPYAGQERVVMPDTSAHALLGDFLANGWRWSIDYTAATEDEAFEWGRQDLAARVLRALRNGLPVTFRGSAYRVDNPKDTTELRRITHIVEDVIGDSGRIITLGRDDESGIEVLDMGPLQ